MVSAQKDRIALVALGGNLPLSAGDSSVILRAALAELVGRGLELRAVSRFFRTPAFPPGAGPDYVNAAAALRTALPPKALLEALHEIEAGLGRVRDQRWGARTLDLDLLAMDDMVLPDAATQAEWRGLEPERQRVQAPDHLILPHPRLQDRAFVLVPLAEIAPQWRHPATGQSVAAMLAARPAADKAAIRPVS